jgi:hypothetical protein
VTPRRNLTASVLFALNRWLRGDAVMARAVPKAGRRIHDLEEALFATTKALEDERRLADRLARAVEAFFALGPADSAGGLIGALAQYQAGRRTDQ